MKTLIIGAGSDLGVHKDGARLGPKELVKDLNYNGKILFFNQDEKVVKSTSKEDLRKNEKAIEEFNTPLYNEIDKNIKDGYFPILLGGDHSVAVASALASKNNNEDIGIIWFDAHTDYHTFKTTMTGNIHGLPLAAITGYHDEELRRFHKSTPINPKKCVIVGARSIDNPEYTNLEDAGATFYTTKDIKKEGIKEIVKKAFQIATDNFKTKTHISYDLDLIDPNDAPGVSIPEKDGITKQEALDLNTEILSYLDYLASYDLVEFNPKYDKNNKTKEIALTILNQTIKAIENK